MKQKIAAIIALTVILLASSTTAIKQSTQQTSVSDDDILTIDGSIIAHVSDKGLGSVYPEINLSETYNLTINTSYIDNAYKVDSILRIPVEVVNISSKEYIFGRYLRSFIFVKRSFNGKLTAGQLIGRFLRSLSRINVFSEGDKYIDVSLNYEIPGSTTKNETANLTIFTFGSLTSLLSREKPVFEYKKIRLDLEYNLKDIIPPVTVCLLIGIQKE